MRWRFEGRRFDGRAEAPARRALESGHVPQPLRRGSLADPEVSTAPMGDQGRKSRFDGTSAKDSRSNHHPDL
jgi:hypothetical protein